MQQFIYLLHFLAKSRRTDEMVGSIDYIVLRSNIVVPIVFPVTPTSLVIDAIANGERLRF